MQFVECKFLKMRSRKIKEKDKTLRKLLEVVKTIVKKNENLNKSKKSKKKRLKLKR